MAKPILEELRAQLEDATEELLPEDDLVFRPMFGALGGYANGRFFAILYSGGLALKLAPEDQAQLLKLRGAARFQFGADGPISKQYIVVPTAMRRNPGTLAPWVRRSIQFARSQPAPKPKRRRMG